MNKVNIIIVANKNNYHLINDCLLSFYNENKQYTIIVANNGTPLLNSQLTDNRYIEYTEAYTYGYVLNDIMAKENLKGSDIVLINAGIGCKIEVIEALRDKAYSDHNIGIVAVGNSTGQIIAPSRGIVYIKADYFDSIYDQLRRPFNEYFITEEYTLFDLAMRSMYNYKANEIHEMQFDHNRISLPSEDEESIRCDRQMMEREWKSKYFNITPNLNIVNAISPNKNGRVNILEVGCDMGATLLEIKKRYSQFSKIVTYGIESNEISAKIASNVVDYVFDRRIEEIDLSTIHCIHPLKRGSLPDKVKFDYIIFGDVLEHLADPEAVVKNCRNALKANGKIIASMPNLMHISVMKELIKGNFSYTDRGLLDRTHCHLFTRKEIIKMFEDTEYKVNMKSLETSVTTDERSLIRTLVRLSGGETSDSDYTTFQYLCTVTSKQ